LSRAEITNGSFGPVNASLEARVQGQFNAGLYSAGHPLVAHGLPTDWAYWQEADTQHLRRCDEVVVVTLDGCDQSVGVQEEIRPARQLGKSVRYVAPENAAQPHAVLPTLAQGL
jgi:hypothetical protein